ncbi:MAG: helicase [Leptospiraceae bacterium]|nr:helicase [Leptospiraceae bacterium]MCK6380025.1 helicase [Leptospiraceae bacterium]
MEKDGTLIQELEKLDLPELKKAAVLWNLQKFSGKDKKTSIKQLTEAFSDEFFLKGVLEKLTPIQVTIYTSILKNKNVLTLGEIVRKTTLPPLNAEMELNVLRKYCLVYQRKNRERLTNNLDKYHAYEEIAQSVKIEQNVKSEKYKISLDKILSKLTEEEIDSHWIKLLSLKKKFSSEELYKAAISSENIQANIHSLSELERETLRNIFLHGGIVEAETIRNYIHVNRGKFEQVIPVLLARHLVTDVYFIEDRFIRVIVIPKEILGHLQDNPILQAVKKGTKQKQEKIAKNDLDFFLNIKKMVSFISRKGINLAKSGKIKQSDNKRTEQDLLKMDIDIFPEKGQVYQIELILPILKLLGYVDIKGEGVVLIGEIDEFQKKDIFEVMNMVIHEANEARAKRVNPPEVFSAMEVPLYDKLILDKCVSLILDYGNVNISVIFSIIVRDHLILSPGFKIKNFEADLSDLRRDIISAIFYLHLFGLLEVEYPSRNLSLSDLGKNFFQSKSINRHTEKGGIMINPDFTIIAFPEKVSMIGIHLLKAFTELKDFDRVYTFTLTKEAFQQGILLGYDSKQFIQFLRESNKAELAQNLLFLFQDWGENLPIVTITEDCVLLKTCDSIVMELLMGQIKGKRIVIEEISPVAILIDKNKIGDVITISEKLNLIIKLIR